MIRCIWLGRRVILKRATKKCFDFFHMTIILGHSKIKMILREYLLRRKSSLLEVGQEGWSLITMDIHERGSRGPHIMDGLKWFVERNPMGPVALSNKASFALWLFKGPNQKSKGQLVRPCGLFPFPTRRRLSQDHTGSTYIFFTLASSRSSAVGFVIRAH